MDAGRSLYDTRLDELAAALRAHLNTYDMGERARHGLLLAAELIEMVAYDLAVDTRTKSSVTYLILTAAELQKLAQRLPANLSRRPGP